MPETYSPPTSAPETPRQSLAELHPGLAVYQHHGGKLEDITVHEREPRSEIPGEPVIYDTPDQAGSVYATVIMDKPDARLDWRRYSHTRRLNRQAMLTTESGHQYFINGDRIIDVVASREVGRPIYQEVAPDESLSTATVGKSWINPFGVTDPISKIEVAEEKVSANKIADKLEDYEQIGGKGEIAELVEWLGTHKESERSNKVTAVAKRAGRLALSGIKYGLKADAKAIEYAAKLDEKVIEQGYRAGKKVIEKGQEYGQKLGHAAAKNAGRLALVHQAVIEEIKEQGSDYDQIPEDESRKIGARAASVKKTGRGISIESLNRLGLSQAEASSILELPGQDQAVALTDIWREKIAEGSTPQQKSKQKKQRIFSKHR